MIDLKNVSMRYGAVLALNALSVEIRAGEAVAIWGPNGAGKTTAMRCILGLVAFDGSVEVAGVDVARNSKAARQQIGFVPQTLAFHDDLSIDDTMAFYAGLKKVGHARAADLVAELGLAPHAAKLVGALSGGLKQRLALAIALLSDPAVLLLDEPTSNLDVHGRDDLLTLLKQLRQRGKTLLFSSHRLDEVLLLADRVLVLDQGSLVADCPPGALHKHAGWQAVLRVFMPTTAIPDAVAALTGQGYAASPNGHGVWVRVVPGNKAAPIRTLVEAGIDVSDFEIEHLNYTEAE